MYAKHDRPQTVKYDTTWKTKSKGLKEATLTIITLQLPGNFVFKTCLGNNLSQKIPGNLYSLVLNWRKEQTLHMELLLGPTFIVHWGAI